MRTLAVVAAVLALWCAIVFWSAAAFSQPPVPGGDKPALLIGGSIAQTGMLAELAREYIKGLELWQEDVNARGGLAGRRVELRLFDDVSGARNAAELTATLIAQDKVDLLVGPFGSPATLEAAVIADREHRIMLNATGAAPNIHKKSLRYVFQLPPPSGEQALPVLKVAAMLGTRTLTVFAGKGAGSAIGRLREEAKLAGIAMVEFGGLPAPILRPPNYPPLIRKIDPKSVLLVFDETPRLAELLREMKLAGFRPGAFVAPNVAQPDFIARVGMDAEYSIGLSSYEPRARTRGNAEFVKSFQAKHKRMPDSNAAFGWAAGQLLEAAVARAGSMEIEPLRDALSGLETETVIGAYKVDRFGAQLAATTLLVQIQKGRREVLWPEAYQSAAAILAAGVEQTAMKLVRLRREDSLLLVVDVQQKLAPAVHEGRRVIARCGALVRAARLLNVPVLLSEHCPDVLGITVPELLAVAPEDSRMRKVFFSCADQNECLVRIDSSARRQVVLAGMEGHVSVMQTALGLAERSFQIYIVQDAVGSRRPADCLAALERMRAAGASIVTAEMVMFEWMNRADVPELPELLAIVKED